MKHAAILTLCFLPLVIIYVVMKISLWLSSSMSEINYVRDDSKRPHGPYVANAYEDIDSQEKNDGNF